MTLDVRHTQIFIMATILFAGILRLDFSIVVEQVFLTLIAGSLTQLLFQKCLHIKNLALSSTVITCFGFCFLLRSDSYWVHPVFCSLAIASKFLLRYHKKHLFNPSAFGIVLALCIAPGAWVSPGQWGFQLLPSLWLLLFGTVVAGRAHRLDISLWFIGFYFLGLGLRNYWLGYEWALWTHSLSNGSILLFALFMISDPKTAPQHPIGRMLQALFVATFSMITQYYFYINNGFLFAIILSTPLVVLLNHYWQATPMEWSQLRPQLFKRQVVNQS